jgi:acetyl/propionyl-CoA carboxylase alpha subunit
MFERILIAQRGAAAAAIARSLRRIDRDAVALVLSDSEEGVHVEACDETFVAKQGSDGAVDYGDLATRAKERGIPAIHPGWDTAPAHRQLREACEAAGVVYLGPSLESESLLADRTTIAARLEEEGVRFGEVAEEERPRLLDVIVVADHHGNVRALPEIERSLRRGDETQIEEAPSADLIFRADGLAIRHFLLDAAVRTVTALGLRGLVTVHAAISAEGSVRIVDLSLGLPRSGGLIEMISPVDVLELQLLVTEQRELPLELEMIEPSGHAIAAHVRLVHESDLGRPASEVRFPPAPMRRIRFEPALSPGGAATRDDGMTLAHIISYAPIRHQALLQLDRFVAELEFAPLQTTKGTIRRLLSYEGVRAGHYDVTTMDRAAAQAPSP